MKALLALLLACPASAVTVRTTARASASAVAPVPSLAAPSFAAPALAPAALAVPSLGVPSAPAPVAAPRAEPAAAQAQIAQVAAAVAPRDGAPAPEAALSAAFDGADAPKAAPVPVSAVAEAHAASELALSRAHAARFPKPVERSWKTRAWEAAELGMHSLPFHIGAALSSNWVPEAWQGVGQAAVWTAAGAALVHTLRGLRAQVVGGWQASHDQKYRVGYDGRMRDVRGHKYGTDRWEEYAPGQVSRRETLAVYAAMLLSAAPWLMGHGWASAASFMGLAGLGVLAALRRRRL